MTLNNITTAVGRPLPLGAQKNDQAVNFALFSRHATQVTLVIAPPDTTHKPTRLDDLSFPLDPIQNKTGDIWHILLNHLPIGFSYGYQVTGPAEFINNERTGHGFSDQQVLLDPYAKNLTRSQWGEKREGLGRYPACQLADSHYDWEGDQPPATAMQDTIIYELHVRGFTQHSSANVSYPGTFHAITEKINYLRALGITAVELMPVTEFDETDSVFINPTTGQGLLNYWGYSPLSFFAPKAGFARPGHDPVTEFRDMVKALHRAGIEVILDMVFNHTAEGSWAGQTTSLRGIDNTIYYLLTPEQREYFNFSGCGNTCNCNHPVMRDLIIDALHWWVVDMHVDGFRFDLASILGRAVDGSLLDDPPVVERIAEDPVLSNTKIIAEAWDAAGLYQVGNFSSHRRWAEWNGKFRDDVRAFCAGHDNQVPALATRLAGSSDLYQHNNRLPHNSINFICSHDGFTLADLVSYNEKHNDANGEQNRDGDNHNISWNSGDEGSATDTSLIRLRARRLRTMGLILLVSQGVPMLTAGDEFGRSQGGNNNAYCQDSPLSWVNWNLVQQNQALHRFFSALIHLRRQHPVFRRSDFFTFRCPHQNPLHEHEIIWQGLTPNRPDWSASAKTLGFSLNGTTPDTNDAQDDDFFILFSGHRQQTQILELPPPPSANNGIHWHKIIDTSQKPPADIVSFQSAPCFPTGWSLVLPPMTGMVFQATS